VLNDISSAQSVAHTLSRLNLSGAAARRFNGAIKKLVETSTRVITQRTQLEETLPQPDFPTLPEQIHNRTLQAAHDACEIYFDMKRRRSTRAASPAEMAAHNGQRQRYQTFLELFFELFFPTFFF